MSLISKETPAGAVNGSNKIFTTTYTIAAVDDIFIDGAIYLGSFTVADKTITLNAAPTTSIRVDYFTDDPNLVDSSFTPLSSLLKKLNDDIKIDPKNKLWSQEVKTTALNDAYFQVQKDLNFRMRECQKEYDITTLPNVREYGLPANFIHMDECTYDNGVPLNDVDKMDLVRQQRFSNPTTGTPYDYYLYGALIGLDPIPDSSKTLRLFMERQLPTLTSSQGSVLPNHYDLAIVKYASYLIWSQPRGNRQTAQEKATDYKQQINTLRTAYLMRKTTGLRWKPARRRMAPGPRSL